MKAAAIDPVDWRIRQGQMAVITGRTFPRAMGMEFSGVVEAIGSAVTRLRGGDEVFGTVPMKASGAFAEMLVTKESLVARKPAALPFVQAACLSIAPVAAWRGLFDKARLAQGPASVRGGLRRRRRPGRRPVRQDAGAFVAGSCAAQDMAAARQQGVEPVCDDARDDLAALKGRFDVFFDAAGKLQVEEGQALRVAGRGVLLDLNFSVGRVLRSVVSRRYKIVMGIQSVDVLETMARKVAVGVLQIEVGRTEPLDRAIGLITDVEQGRKAKGRAVILMG